tara:strand:+ start:899 stop:1747 length:849 start_codon:yes stop_codon:yes gene_type:complete
MSFTVDPSKASAFKILMENIADINNQVNITLYKTHFYVQGMDPSHVCLFELKLADTWFQEYNVTTNTTVGIDLNIVNKIISCCGKTQSIQFQTGGNVDKITLNLKGGKGTEIDKSFETAIYDFEMELLNITDIDSDIDISIDAQLLNTLVEQIAVFGDSIRFECSDSGITLISKENKHSTEMKCKIDIDKISTYSTTDEDVNNEYSILYYSKLCKYAKLMKKDATVDIQIATDVPLIMKYNLSDCDPYECDTDEGSDIDTPSTIQSVMMLCLAPKVTDDFED